MIDSASRHAACPDTAIQSKQVVSVQTVEDYDQVLCKVCRVWVPFVVGEAPAAAEEEDNREVCAVLELCLPVLPGARSGLTAEESSCIESLAKVSAQALSLVKERMKSQRAVQQATAMAEAAVAVHA